MKYRIIAVGAILAVATACGASQDDKIVLKDPESGTTRTYKEVRDRVASGEFDIKDGNCSELTAYGAGRSDVEYPAGQAEFVKACEEGLKAKNKS